LTNATTWLVGDVFNGTGSSNPGRNMSHVVGTTLYFDATLGPAPSELWAYDTANGSLWQVTEIFDPASMASTEVGLGEHLSVQIGHTLYFNANDGHSGVELWAHDLLHGHTWLVADIRQGNSSFPGRTLSTVVGNTIYFSANDGSNGHEVWAHSAENRSTWMIHDVNPGANGSDPGVHFELLVGDTLYFSARTDEAGSEVWWMTMDHMILYG
jgi:ELWxxDGT repeat protein